MLQMLDNKKKCWSILQVKEHLHREKYIYLFRVIIVYQIGKRKKNTKGVRGYLWENGLQKSLIIKRENE